MTKKIISLFLVFSLVGLLGIPVIAQEETPPSEPTQSTLEARQAKRKETIKVTLSTADSTKIAAKCQAAQAVITKANERIEKIYTSRTDKYSKLIAKLTALSSKIDNQDIDTTVLDKEILQTQALVDSFLESLETHKQAVTDAKDIDCKTDPEGFKIALEDAKSEIQNVRTDSVAIKAHIKDKIKPELQNIRAILEADANSIPSNQGGNTTQSDAQPTDPDTPVSNPAEGEQ